MSTGGWGTKQNNVKNYKKKGRFSRKRQFSVMSFQKSEGLQKMWACALTKG